MKTAATLAALCAAATLVHAAPNGIYNDSPSARGMSLGGNETAAAHSPLEALSANPAALGETERTAVDVGLFAGFADGEFHNDANPGGASFSETGVLPTGAISTSFGPLRFGLAFYPKANLRADWEYRDALGGLGGATTYGNQTQKSEILLLRTALGAAWRINETLSIGASVGLLYNRNQLDAPYIFQSQPVLKGVKTRLNLETDGWSTDGQFGILWKPLANLRMGVSYNTETRVHTNGRANGDANVQLKNVGLGAARSDFNYDAEVTNDFPQSVSVGLAWQPVAHLTVLGQFDWINWQDSFRTLSVHLRNGNNADLNGLVAANKLDDNIPLDWRDQFVLRAGLEYELTGAWTLRAGYSYSPNPVPSDTLTPLTAAIAEHTVGAGIGFKSGAFSLDAAWEWALPVTEHVGNSALLDGEYSHSSVRVSTQWLALTAGYKF